MLRYWYFWYLLVLRNFSLFIFALLLLTSLEAQAGDRMNIDFLLSQAKKADKQITNLTKELNEDLYTVSKSQTLYSAAEGTSEALFGASFFIDDFDSDRFVGTAATGLGLLSVIGSAISDKLNEKHTKQLIARLDKKNISLEQRVNELYFEFTNGSAEARDELVQLTSAEIVQEVENNILMENFWKEQAQSKGFDHLVKTPKPNNNLQDNDTSAIPINAKN
jgi:hypothetical protein